MACWDVVNSGMLFIFVLGKSWLFKVEGRMGAWSERLVQGQDYAFKRSRPIRSS